MTCSSAREALSGRLDGETPEDPAALDAHLAGCRGCRRWLSAARDVTRRTRLRVAPPVPDLTARILAAVQLDDAARRPGPPPHRFSRLGLVLIAVAQLALTLPVLLLGHDRAAPEHVARELGSFDLALAVGFLAAAGKPVRAAGMLPFIGAAAAALLLTAGVDVAAGRAAVLEEAPHLLPAAGWLLLRSVTGAPAGHPDPAERTGPGWARPRRLARRRPVGRTMEVMRTTCPRCCGTPPEMLDGCRLRGSGWRPRVPA